MAEKKKKNKKWIKARHSIVRAILFAILYPVSKIRYGLKLERLKEKEPGQYLILYNHQTAFDQFFVGMAFGRHLYYVASEDIFSNGFVSKLISFLVAPIPIKKQTTDLRAVMNCIRVVKEGGSIAIAPEGNRTYSGKTEYMNPAIAPLARKLGLPIAFFRIEGGYGTHPRWSDKVRRGDTCCRVSRVLTPEEYKDMTDGELMEIIRSELYVNEAVADRAFRSPRLAEYLERALYTCPCCGLTELRSSRDIIECKKCSLKVRYTENKRLEAISGDFPFEFVNDWYEWQQSFIRALDTAQYIDTPAYVDTVSVSKVIPYKNKALIFKCAESKLFADRIEITSGEEKIVFPFDKASAVTVLGRNKVDVYIEKEIFQIKADKRFNALRYVNLFHKYQNEIKGDNNAEFLGL